MELKFLPKKYLRKIKKIDKVLENFDLSISDILNMRNTIDNLITKVELMSNALNKLETKVEDTQNDIKAEVKKYNEEVIRYTADNPLKNTDINDVIKEFFGDPNIEIKIDKEEIRE